MTRLVLLIFRSFVAERFRMEDSLLDSIYVGRLVTHTFFTTKDFSTYAQVGRTSREPRRMRSPRRHEDAVGRDSIC